MKAKLAFDTSVLVAALVEDHPEHSRAAQWLRAPKAVARMASAHAFTETWAILTAMPIEPRISGQVALTALQRLERIVTFIRPDKATYAAAAAARCASLGRRSGSIYDALHIITAESEQATLFLTFNARDSPPRGHGQPARRRPKRRTPSTWTAPSGFRCLLRPSSLPRSPAPRGRVVAEATRAA
jgi:predicted nucleic acid-binding protein